MMKKGRIAEVYRFLAVASMAKMTDDEKIALIRLLRQMKPVAVEIQEAVSDAMKQAEQSGMEREAAVRLAERAAQDIAMADVDMDLHRLAQQAFDHLVLSNNWTFAQIDELEGVISGS